MAASTDGASGAGPSGFEELVAAAPIGALSGDTGGGAGATPSFASRKWRISSGFVEAIPKYSANRRVVTSSIVEPFG